MATIDLGRVVGKDGTSPTLSVSEIDGGHTVTITDVNGTQSFDVMDGEDGEGGGDVQTVNSVSPDENGNVQLDAEDVGALSSDPDEGTETPEMASVPINADLLGGKAPEYYLSPRNLLDNSDFSNPVNQRGVTEWSIGYGIDRWIVYNMTATVVSNGILFHNLIDGVDHVFQQRLPLKTLNRAKQYTAVIYSTDGGIIFGVVNMLNDGFDEISFYLDSENTYEYAALYEGSYTADTLPPYVPKGYAAELAECRRYFRHYGDYGLYCYCYADGYISGFVFDQPMRAAPSILNLSVMRLADFVSVTPGSGHIRNPMGITYLDVPEAAVGQWYRITQMDLSAEL